MDYYQAPHDVPAYYYDIQKKDEADKNIDRVEAAAAVKKQAFRAMDQLEGWCSRHKASVLIDMVLMVKPDTIVEIGVFGGKSLVPMAVACKANGNGVAIGIDPWSTASSIEGMEDENLNWWGSIDHEKIYQDLVKKVGKFGLSDQIQLLRTTSQDALPIFDIDILHIDGNHSEESAMYDVTKWIPLVREGGIVIIDDINWPGPMSTLDWVEESCVKLAEFPENGTNWGIWIKK